MCGIAGFLRKEDQPDGKVILKNMLYRLKHRGPDECGLYVKNNIYLGHTRLSIIDIVAGQQPMSNSDGTLWITYNGEIFNYIELREELTSKGYKFRTHSDTEVLLLLFEEYGNACLQKLNGQFAFAIWDNRKQELFLARDRVGIRPLFYTDDPAHFVFSSEIKAILEYPGVEPEISIEGLSEVFTFWAPLSPNTVFKNIFELPPGHYMTVNRKGVSIRSYWTLDMPEQGKERQLKLEEAIEEFDDLFRDAVKIRMRADVPVGAYLSGGIDSSITTAYIKEIFPDLLHTFSIGFSEKEFDESAYQRMAVGYLKTDHESVFCNSSDISEIFPEIIWHTETPVLRTAPAPMFLLSRNVRANNYKVVITGEGADEMLAGYNIFKEQRIRRFWAKQPKSRIRPLLLQKLYPYLAQMKGINPAMLKFFFGYKLSETDSPFYSHLLRWNNTSRIRNYLSGEVKEIVRDYDPLERLGKKLPGNFDRLDPLSKAQWLEATVFMSDYLLSSQGDRMAMGNSVEGRYPFLDHRIIEFSASLPPGFKLHGLKEKYILKKLMKGKLPDQIIDRPKQAYRAPIKSSFISHDPGYIEDLLTKDSINNAGLFHYPSVEKLLKNMRSGKNISEMDNMALTGIISTQLLHKQFVKGDKPEIKNAAGVCRIVGEYDWRK